MLIVAFFGNSFRGNEGWGRLSGGRWIGFGAWGGGERGVWKWN